MSLNDELNETECIPEQLSTLQEPVRVWATLHFFFVTGIVVFSLLAFYLLKDRLVYLKKRSFSALVLNGIGQFCIIIPGNGIHIANSPSNPFISCPIWNLAILTTIPLILTSVLSTTLSFRYRAALSRALGDETKEISDKTWFLASGQFSAVFLVTSMVLIFGVSFLVSIFHCPDFGATDRCDFLGITDGVTLGFSYVPSFIVVGFTIYLSRELRTYPDPFHLLSELKYACNVALVLSVFVLVIVSIDPGNVEKERPQRFSWGPLLDLAVMSLFFWRCPLQIYKAYKFDADKASNIEHSLDKVMSDPTGFQLLKQHMINEFNAENILFIAHVDEYRMENDAEKKKEIALEIYEKYLKFKRINVGYEVFSTVDEAIVLDNIEDDVFDEAYTEVKILIKFDSFLRFIKTEKFLVYAGLKQMKRGSTAEDMI